MKKTIFKGVALTALILLVSLFASCDFLDSATSETQRIIAADAKADLATVDFSILKDTTGVIYATDGVPTPKVINGAFNGKTVIAYYVAASKYDLSAITLVLKASTGAKCTIDDSTTAYDGETLDFTLGKTHSLLVTSKDGSVKNTYTLTFELAGPQAVKQVILKNYVGAKGVNLTIDPTNAAQANAVIGLNTNIKLGSTDGSTDGNWNNGGVNTTKKLNADGSDVTIDVTSDLPTGKQSFSVIEGTSYCIQIYLDMNNSNGMDWDSEYFFRPSDNNDFKATGVAIGDNKMTVDILGKTVTFASAGASGAVTAPAAPVVTATAYNSKVILSWPAVTGAASYVVYMGTSANPTTVVATLESTATGYTATGLTNATPYYFGVVAKNPGGASAAGTANATPTASVPAQPSVSITAQVAPSVTVGWTAIADADYYYVTWATHGGAVIGTKIVTATSITISGLTANQQYDVTVTAYNTTGASATTTVNPTPVSPVTMTQIVLSNYQGLATGSLHLDPAGTAAQTTAKIGINADLRFGGNGDGSPDGSWNGGGLITSKNLKADGTPVTIIIASDMPTNRRNLTLYNGVTYNLQMFLDMNANNSMDWDTEYFYRPSSGNSFTVTGLDAGETSMNIDLTGNAITFSAP